MAKGESGRASGTLSSGVSEVLKRSSAELLLERVEHEGAVFSVGGSTGIFDASLSEEIDAANTDALVLRPAALVEDDSWPGGMPWRDIRRALIQQSRRLNAPAELARIHSEMRAAIKERAGTRVDLVQLVASAVARPLIRTVIRGVSPASLAALARDQDARLRRQLDEVRGETSVLGKVGDYWKELHAARAVAREMRLRATRQLPPRGDFADAILALEGRIGRVRRNYLVMTLLAAVSTAPAAVAACLLFELLSRPEWLERIRGEFAAVAADQLYSDPAAALPGTLSFIKETLRLWPFPPVTRRVAHRDLEVRGIAIRAGETYDLSAFVLQRLPASWGHAQVFDPDRWLARGCPSVKGSYVPYGFAPRTCIGAALGQSQLILFCELAACRFEFDLDRSARPHIGTDVLAIPRDFYGVVRPRSVSAP
jgi:cytochrome P450